MNLPRRSVLSLPAVFAMAGCAAQQKGGATPSGPTMQAHSSAPKAPVPVTVGLTYIPNVQFCAFYLGVKEGLFKDLEVTLRHHGEQEGLFEALQLGREDVVFASADEAVIAGDLATVATAYQRYPAEVVFAGKAETLGDLRGKSLGIPGRFGSSYHAALVALDSAGLTEDDVELVEIGFTTVSALTTGSVDAVIGFSNNELVQFVSQGFEVTSLPVSEEAMLVGPSLITLPDKAEDPIVAAIVEGMKQAEVRAIEDPEAALDATLEQVPALAEPEQMANAKLVLEATSRLWLDESGAVSVDVDEEAMQRMQAFLRKAGIRP